MRHTITALVEDKPGVLNRVASLLRRRMLNVESLTAAPTAKPGVGRMTFVIDTDAVGAGRVVATMYKLVNVLECSSLAEEASVSREQALIKVKANSAALTPILESAGGKIVAEADGVATIELAGEPAQVDAAITQLETIGIVDMVRSGRIALKK